MVVISARPKERKLADGLRSTLYKGVSSDLPDLSVLQVAEQICPSKICDGQTVLPPVSSVVPLTFGDLQSDLKKDRQPQEWEMNNNHAPHAGGPQAQDLRSVEGKLLSSAMPWCRSGVVVPLKQSGHCTFLQ
ncbi:hypothetical protein G5714_006000 [Onychostoma macrolepis]|uniref:Uncharacterized protein n=1 Tax=Onychostoma macrolepis TaxID=369639 RepID=A0A7J6D2L7_9TELE|nr:hypothetical protein G5714_006000 [Onychostoma macrolepis]